MKFTWTKLAAIAAMQWSICSLPAEVSAQGPIASGETLTGTIAPAGDSDAWVFHADVGDAIVVRVGEISQSGSFNPRITLFGPGGAQLATGNGVVAAEIVNTASNSGTHTIVVDDVLGTSATGAYRLTLARTGSAVVVSPGDEGGPMTNGVMHTGTINVGDLDVWTVSASAGDAIVVRMGETAPNSPLKPHVRIYGPTGMLNGTGTGSAVGEVATTAGGSGTYLVVVADNSSGFGSEGEYRLTLAKTGSAVVVSPGDEGGPMTNGVMHTGTINVGDLDVWTVSASAGDAIVVRMGETAPNSPLKPHVRIYGPTGMLNGTGTGSAVGEVATTAGGSGTYLVVVADNSSGFGSEGEYRLTLAKTGSAVVVSPGDEGGPMSSTQVETATIDVGDLDVWTISAVSGQAIAVTMSEVTSGSPLAPRLRLYSPTGTLVRNAVGNASAQVSITAPSTGTYLLIACDASNGLVGYGRYRLSPTTTVDVPGSPLALELMLAPAAPNPFSNRTVLRYRLPGSAATALRVFDAQGRLVRTLVDEASPAPGEHEAVWDGRDAAGRTAPPGMYLARLDTNGRPLTRKVSLAPQ